MVDLRTPHDRTWLLHNTSGRSQVSPGGEFRPIWDADIRELFFFRAHGMMVVWITAEPTFEVGTLDVSFATSDKFKAAKAVRNRQVNI